MQRHNLDLWSSPAFYATLGGISFGVAMTGAIFAPWPWWLSLFQGFTASAFFYLAIETDERLEERDQDVCM